MDSDPNSTLGPTNGEYSTQNTDRKTNTMDGLLNFFQIRKQFEEKSKPKSSSALGQVSPSPPQVVSDFQRLYPNYRDLFTKRQFAAVENCFNNADKNQDGYLEPKEVKQLMEEYQQSINLCDAEVIVSMGDHDEDGKLSAKEFVELCRPAAETLRNEQHMEGNSPVCDKEFLSIIVQNLRNFLSPVNIKVKGTLRYFEGMISGGDKDKKETMHKTPLTIKSRRHSAPEESTSFVRSQFSPIIQHTHTLETVRNAFTSGPQVSVNHEESTGNKNPQGPRTHVSPSESTSAAVDTLTMLGMPGTNSSKGNFDFDLILIGSCFSSVSAKVAMKAQELGKRVALVRTSSSQQHDLLEGRMWRNENTEKAAKLLVHHSNVIGASLNDAESALAFGWNGKDGKPILGVQHDWPALLERIQEYLRLENEKDLMHWQTKSIKSLYSAQAYKILDSNSVELQSVEYGWTKRITGNVILCDSTEEAIYPNGLNGTSENCVTFLQMLYRGLTPRRVLVLGNDEEAVENAGLLVSLHFDVTVCPLKGELMEDFDKDMAWIIRKMLLENEQKLEILDPSWIPITVELLDGDALNPEYRVTFYHNGEQFVEVYNCVIVNSRDFCKTSKYSIVDRGELDAGTDVLELIVSEGHGKEVGNEVFVDILHTIFPEEDSLVKSLNKSFQPRVMLFSNFEYAWIGMTEDTATKLFGKENVTILDFHAPCQESVISCNFRQAAFAKLIAFKTENDRIVGLHVIAPNAKQMIQGFALALQLGATAKDLDRLEPIPGTILHQLALHTSHRI